LLKLDSYIRRDVTLSAYFPSFVTGAKYGDHYYAWGALAGGSVALYYNRDQFTRLGLSFPDETWDWAKFVDAASKLTTYAGDQHDPSHVSSYGADSIVDWRWDLVLAEDAGDILQPGGTKSNLDSRAALESFAWMTAATGGGYWPSERYPNASKASFVNGKMAMQIEYSSYALGNANQIKQTFAWDVAPLPKGKQARYIYGEWGPILAAAATHYPDDEIIDQTSYNALLNPALTKIWKGQATPQQAINEVIGPLNHVLADNT
jgi:maltose-binding protein MalE